MTPEEFKEIRLKSGKSQAALALYFKLEGLPVSHGRISNWELGYSTPIPAEYAEKMEALK